MSVNKVSNTDGSLTPIATNTSNSLSYLSDVDIISPSTGQILQYDGTEWKNGQPAYQINDTAETNLADDDKIPFYDTSASNKRSSTWSNIKAKLKSYFDSIYSTIARADAQEDLLRDTVGWTGKNLLPITLADMKRINSEGTWSDNVYTYNNIACTVNTDKNGYVTEVIANGNNSAGFNIVLLNYNTKELDFSTVAGESVIISGCPSGGSAATYSIYGYRVGGGTINARDTGDGDTFTFRSDNSTWNIAIAIAAGTSVNNLVFKPMLRYAIYKDLTEYYTYHPSVEEYCASKQLLDYTVGWLGNNSAIDFNAWNIDSNGVISADDSYKTTVISGNAGDKFTIKQGASTGTVVVAYYTSQPAIGSVSYNGSRDVYNTNNVEITMPVSGYAVVRFNSTISNPIISHITVEEVLGNKVGWDIAGKSVKKNIFNLKEAVISVSNYTTLTNTETGVKLSNTGSYTYRGASFVFEGNDYWWNKTLIISSQVTVTSGAGRIGIGYSDDGSTYTDIFNENVSSGKYEKTFSAGNHKYYRLILQCTLGTAATGDVIYNELMLRDSRIIDPTFESFIYDNTELLSYADNGVLGAKNALSVTLEEVKDNNTYGTWSGNVYTLYGTSFTVYTDDYGYVNKVTVTGAPTANSGLVLKRNFTLDNDYIVNGIIGGSNSTYLISILVSGSTYITDFDGDMLVPKGTYQTLTVSIRANYNPNGKEFYPMLRLATDTDPTYQPYAKTNRQLTVGKVDNSVIAPVENGATCQNPDGYAISEHFQKNGKFCTAKAAIAYGETFILNTNYVEGSVADSIEDLYSNIGLKSTPVSAIVANNLPILKRDITSIFYGSSLRSEIAEGNFKNVRVGDYIVGQSTGSIYYVAECDGWLGRGDTEMQTHHLRLMLFKAAGITQLWAGYKWAGDTSHYSSNDLNRCPWNAATDVDPTSATASGVNSTNITRTYSGASVSAYMGSFIRDRLDNRLLPNCFEADFGSANILQYKNWLGNSYNADIVSGAISTWTGGTSNAAWYARKLDLPSEVELYGSRICSSSFYDVGTQCEQLALFKQAKINDFFPRMEMWTKAVSSSSYASRRGSSGSAGGSGASFAYWACPLACVS